jgi:hypothetical protein
LFADSLFQEFAGWERYGTVVSDPNDGMAMALCVDQPETGRALEIRTDDGEITVSYDLWHSHVGSFLGISDSEAIELAIADIRDIVSEKSVIRVDCSAGKWAGSSLEDVSDTLAAKPGVTTNIYSWRGTYDRTF